MLILAFTEHVYALFSFVPRSAFNAFFLLSTLACSLYGITALKLSRGCFLAYLLICLYITSSALLSYLMFGGVLWAGTAIKLLVYTNYLVYFGRRLNDPDEVLSFLFHFSMVVSVVALIGGLLTNNFMVLNGRERFSGLSHTPSIVACFSGFFVILSCYFYKKYKYFLISLFGFLLGLSMLFLSGSRQPLFGLFASLVLSILIVQPRLIVFLLGSILLFLGLIFAKIVPGLYELSLIIHAVSQTLHAIMYLDMEVISGAIDGSSLSRLRYLLVGIEYVSAKNIWFGTGLNSFPLIFLSQTGEEAPATHNLLLTVFTQFGIIGLVAFFSWMVFEVIQCVRQKDLFRCWLFSFIFLGLSLNNPEYFTSLVIIYISMYLIVIQNCNYESK